MDEKMFQSKIDNNHEMYLLQEWFNMLTTKQKEITLNLIIFKFTEDGYLEYGDYLLEDYYKYLTEGQRNYIIMKNKLTPEQINIIKMKNKE